MIISRTPFRVSFFGGGTDYPAWFEENGGSVLATSIDKYCYITCRYLPPFFEHKHRIVYSKVENVNQTEDIQHPVVRVALELAEIKEGMEIHHDGDLPARAGLGSSSAFSVGMLNSLYALKGKMIPKKHLAEKAIHLERNILKENVGSQDQIITALGGFKRIDFNTDHSFSETPVIVEPERKSELENHLLLFYTGISRFASNIAKKKIANIPKKKTELGIMRQMVDEGLEIITSGQSISDFGKLLHESWKLKRELSEGITTSLIDEIYQSALSEGALGGKLLGAGGGGFMLIFARPENHINIKKRLKDLLCIPFNFEGEGSQIILFQPDSNPRHT
jgi:D-glycero-alpha-D-manno-heptose-7-phosphate kinase